MEAVMRRIEVVSDEDVMGGEPCIQGTRICAETIVQNLRAGHPLATILKAYPTLPVGGVEASILWAEAQGMKWRA